MWMNYIQKLISLSVSVFLALVETIVNSVIFKKNISSAVDAPRLRNELEPPDTYCESKSIHFFYSHCDGFRKKKKASVFF